jgi:hypothetical protein
MKLWGLGRAKGPGYGLSRDYYLSVLIAKAPAPILSHVIHPDGADGAVKGFGAPLLPTVDKTALNRPMERGPYAMATKDRKTILKMLVLSKEEAGYDPEPLIRSALAANLDREALNRARATWTLAQFTFESHDPQVHVAVDFLLSLCRRLATLSDGLIADPIAQRYLLPDKLMASHRPSGRILGSEHVSIGERTRNDGIHLYTLGLRKFSLPEFEITGLRRESTVAASLFLNAASQKVLDGDIVAAGDVVKSGGAAFEVRDGGFDRSLWEGINVLELLPPRNLTPDEALARL